jgi:hypothetical protein
MLALSYKSAYSPFWRVYAKNPYLRVLSPTAILTHEEHDAVTIPQGNWEIRIQREYSPVRVASPLGEGWQYVAD